ncbi:MAG: HAMP domain-containing histidine kinase, partial [Proteobacteria bacterium]
MNKVQSPHTTRRASQLRMIVVGVVVVINLVVLASELEFVSPDLQKEFLITKAALSVVPLFFAYWLYRRPFSYLANTLTMIASFIIPVHSTFYRPGYLIAYFQTGIAVSFLMAVPKWTFRLIVLTFGAVHFYLLSQLWAELPDSHVVQSQSDQIIIASVFTFILMVVHHYFVGAARRRTENQLHFASIGKKASSILHDLKGLMTAPKIYLSLIEKGKLTAGGELEAVIHAVASDLARVHDAIQTLNKITVSSSHQREICSPRVAFENARTLLQYRLRSATISAQGDAQVFADFGQLTSVFVNALVNSHTAHQERTPHRELRVEVEMVYVNREEQVRITILDNAGGFSPVTLEALRNGQNVSEFRQGTGLGI